MSLRAMHTRTRDGAHRSNMRRARGDRGAPPACDPRYRIDARRDRRRRCDHAERNARHEHANVASDQPRKRHGRSVVDPPATSKRPQRTCASGTDVRADRASIALSAAASARRSRTHCRARPPYAPRDRRRRASRDSARPARARTVRCTFHVRPRRRRRVAPRGTARADRQLRARRRRGRAQRRRRRRSLGRAPRRESMDRIRAPRDRRVRPSARRTMSATSCRARPRSSTPSSRVRFRSRLAGADRQAPEGAARTSCSA